MRLFEKPPAATGTDSEGRCCSLDDFHDAKKVAQDLGFSHFVLDFETRFQQEVIQPFIQSYLNGQTPNPCINCNKSLKFDSLIERARGISATHVATGHYARIRGDSEGYALLKAKDPGKDQSYFLYHLNQINMQHLLFPLGGYTKSEIRGLARQLGLHLSEKPESQEICFVTEGRYDKFLEREGAITGDRPGEIRHLDGTLLGAHQGYWKFTVGQRRGLGIAAPNRLFVVRVTPDTNTVWVGENEHLDCRSFTATEVNWCRVIPTQPLVCLAKIRSRFLSAEALVVPVGTDRAEVTFLEPQRAVAPGQAVVFYRDDEVLGGGWIASLRA
jgi:tRNA-specific 2-thiouridylase